MKEQITWCEKYELCLKENLSIREIMQLRDCGYPHATNLRDDAIKYCLENDIEILSKKIPTIAIFAITKLDESYYYNKMIQESKCLKYCGS